MTTLVDALVGECLPLGALPTPLQACPALSRAGLEVVLKRDDLVGDLITGTKVRALAYILHQAQREGVTELITLGEPTSNQCRLVAMLGARAGMRTHVLLRASACNDERDENLAIMRMYGAQLSLLDEDEWRLSGMAAKRLSSRVRKAGGKARFVPFGCGGLPGALGIVDLVRELYAQHGGELPYTHILIPTGSGATLFAFDLALRALAPAGPRPLLVGVSVAQSAAAITAKIDQLYAKTGAKLGLELARSEALHVEDRWRELTPLALLDELERVVDRYGLMPDPYYVLRTFLFLERLAETGQAQRVLVLVSGAQRTLGALRHRAGQPGPPSKPERDEP